MIDALGVPQSVLLLGGTSEIGLAIVDRYLDRRPVRVVLAGRPSERLDSAVARLTARATRVDTVDFDAKDLASQQTALQQSFSAGDIDVAIVAFGVLGDQPAPENDPATAAHLATVNFTAAMNVGIILARAMRRQGHGVIVALSSVAAVRPRHSNFIYGATKAGMDAFYRGLADSLDGSGVDVLVVRAGPVRTRMTAHLPDRPLTSSPEAVAAAVTEAVWRRRTVLWTPRSMRIIAWIIRLLPRRLLRKVP
ncbi:decaprenylphospho-beta-D-erythro-pentofuranosid-2-ulose 2-reductase [Thermomonospora echinospora]|uniref:Decaprenylphospho-beta-D-erythro-pentofuranosid-2-ulose 2-reductase n=1 Tax=Thermomonospora echinospora TaxID=1992 RepID=A0A1H6DMP7_9ACTN|nr:decaprenylphospho-beta-D-erythro-pentofuranosid-2-ulose 2-reductase [Thermomonospora echinospora]SEG86509.1 decaprenylphospho-beta-D-erythro-pentofuranosid-2-ulose 2-reductase [Thermomonospora echinospora]